jgi:hypothetical protein
MKTKYLIGGGLLVLLLFLGVGIAYADTNGGVIHACVKDNGQVRIVNQASDCKNQETHIRWNIVGPQGPRGDIGAIGPAGPVGATGPQGAQGLQGAKGDKGDKGDAGSAGPQGPAGLAGEKGDTGPAGVAGAQGEQGPVGPRGDTGPVGPAGSQGDQGPQGLQGLKGDAGSGLASIDALAGLACTSPAGAGTINVSYTANGEVQLQCVVAPVQGIDEDGDGYTSTGGDCNDHDPAIHPGAVDLPDAAFIDSNCDGVDGDESRAIFVAPNGDDSAAAAGTRAAPLRTITHALAAAQTGGKDQVYVLAGTYNEQVYLHNGISIWGGYFEAPDGSWHRNSTSITRITWSSSTGGMVIAIQGTNLTSATILGDLSISAGNAPAGGSSYAIYCSQCSGLVLERNTIQAGAGGDGVEGLYGQPGANGDPGNDGMPGAAGNDTIMAYGGGGGSTSCLGDGASNGGPGGRGGRGAENGMAGGNGSGYPAGGAGGPGGASGVPVGNGTIGMNGLPGIAGQDGMGGMGGSIVGGFWVGQAGVDGTSGGSGQGGGGGGGGGGLPLQPGPSYYHGTGNGGGGGGAGGCGGKGGKAGTAGGGSFGVFLLNSTGVLFTGNSIATGPGGKGGTGGYGVPGGAGGYGGKGAHVDAGIVGAGGDGGLGGDGGWGGDGGGGAGGVSYGVYTLSTTVSLDGNLFQIGQGGAGGNSLGQPGGNGASGITN